MYYITSVYIFPLCSFLLRLIPQHSNSPPDHEKGPGDPGSNKIPWWIYIGLIYSIFLGLFCIVLGVLIRSCYLVMPSTAYSPNFNLRLRLHSSMERELILLLLNVIILKPAIMCTGMVHEMALKWQLAEEEDKFDPGHIRLEFNSNFRFLQPSYNWRSANGLPANVLAAASLILVYAASSMVLLELQEDGRDYNTVLSFVPQSPFMPFAPRQSCHGTDLLS